jgi:hypothetical protein
MSRWQQFRQHRAEAKRVKEILNEEEHYLF